MATRKESFANMGIDPKFMNSKGGSRLYVAVDKGDEDAVLSLLMDGCPPDLPASTGATPLRKAIDRQRSNLVELLLEHGADPFREMPPPWHEDKALSLEAESTGWYPIHLAVHVRNPRIADIILDAMNRQIAEGRVVDEAVPERIRQRLFLTLEHINDGTKSDRHPAQREAEKTVSYVFCLIFGIDPSESRIFDGVAGRGKDIDTMHHEALLRLQANTDSPFRHKKSV